MIDQLLSSLPLEQRNSELIVEIFRATAKVMEELYDKSMGNYEEVFVDTAIKALQLHAKDLGITFKNDLDLTQRRDLIMANYQAIIAQTTEESIKNIVKAFSNSDVDIKKTDTAGLFNLLIMGVEGIADNIDDIKRTINNIVPAHLGFNFGTKDKVGAYSVNATRMASKTKVYPWFPVEINMDCSTTATPIMKIGMKVKVFPKE